jgi:hypothetical protein
VTFIWISGTALYGGNDPIFDFNESKALVARNAISDALNAQGGIETVGGEFRQEGLFNIGHGTENQGLLFMSALGTLTWLRRKTAT